jgi:hypothetical protein
MPRRTLPLPTPGQRFGRLAVVGPDDSASKKHPRTVCLCDCGTEKVVDTNNLRHGRTRSCGCLERESRYGPPLEERVWAKVEKTEGCWLWTAAISPNGYGKFMVSGRPVNAHRLVYQLTVGPIPDGLDLDHLCRVRHCVNPDHLEPVTRSENLLRGYAARRSPDDTQPSP